MNVSIYESAYSGQQVDESVARSIANQPHGVVITARNATIIAGGAPQQLMAANANRTGWRIQNLSADILYWNDTGVEAGPATAGSSALQPGQDYVCLPGAATLNAIRIYGATTGQKFSAGEWANTQEPASTKHNGVIVAGGVDQVLMPVNPNRESWMLENLSSGVLWFHDIGGPAAADTIGSYSLQPGAVYRSPKNGASISEIHIIGATTGQKFSAVES